MYQKIPKKKKYKMTAGKKKTIERKRLRAMKYGV